MKIEVQAETVATVERERERELLFIQCGIRLLDHTHGLLEKSNNKINKIDLDNKITIKPKNIKT